MTNIFITTLLQVLPLLVVLLLPNSIAVYYFVNYYCYNSSSSTMKLPSAVLPFSLMRSDIEDDTGRRRSSGGGSSINKMIVRTNQSGATLIPLSLYFSDGYAKVELALARGRRAVDKRHAIAEREAKREAERAIGRRAKGIE